MRCDSCPIKHLPELVAEFKCLCGRKFGPANQPPPIAELDQPTTQPAEAWIRERLQDCRNCSEYIEGDRCGILVAKGKAGSLWHPKGIGNKNAQCPKDPPEWDAK